MWCLHEKRTLWRWRIGHEWNKKVFAAVCCWFIIACFVFDFWHLELNTINHHAVRYTHKPEVENSSWFLQFMILWFMNHEGIPWVPTEATQSSWSKLNSFLFLLITFYFLWFSLMESQSGHHPGHHGHSAPHTSTLPHNIHVGGSSHHQINLDNHGHHHHHQKSHAKHKKEAAADTVEAHKPHSTHHTHHHVSSCFVLGIRREF